jgi:hypothetical protein
MVTVRSNVKVNKEGDYGREIEYVKFTILQAYVVNGAIQIYSLLSLKGTFRGMKIQ